MLKDQQNAIDKAKGISCKPMPRWWYDRHAAARQYGSSNQTDLEMNLSILADKKPYFMRYIYPDLMKQYNTYIKNTTAKCAMLFRIKISDLLETPDEKLTEAQREFVQNYYAHMPVSIAGSVMNRICQKVEQALSGDLRKKIRESVFDSSILKQETSSPSELSLRVQQLYKQYCASVKEVMSRTAINSEDEEHRRSALELLKHQFREDALSVCSNAQQLCSVVVGLCYDGNRKMSKRFAWDICGSEILDNLFTSGGSALTYPVKSEQGELEFRGCRYTMVRKECEP